MRCVACALAVVAIFGAVRGEDGAPVGDASSKFFSALRKISENQAVAVVEMAQDALVRVPRQAQGGTQEAFQEMTAAIQEQCRAAKNDKAAREAFQTVQQFQSCMANMGPTEGASFSQACNSAKDLVHRCVKDLNVKIKPCMSNGTQYLPDFLLEVSDSVFTYLCQNDGQNFRDVFMLMGAPCIPQLSEPLQQCSKDTKLSKDPNRVDIPKSLLCGDLKLLKTCAEKSARNHCDSKTTQTITEFMGALYAPCAGCSLSVSLLLLSLLALTAKLF